MLKQQLNKLYYQTHQEQLKTKQKEHYWAKQHQQKKKVKSSLANYYHANNIKVLISLKDYVESSSKKMKLWYRFTAVLNQIKEGISDIMEIMRLKEVMEELISDYWSSSKRQIRATNRWNKLTPAQQATKKKHWQTQLEQEEAELLSQLAQQEKNIKNKQKKIVFANYPKQEPTDKVQCPDCNSWVKELDEENNLCFKCVKNYA